MARSLSIPGGTIAIFALGIGIHPTASFATSNGIERLIMVTQMKAIAAEEAMRGAQKYRSLLGQQTMRRPRQLISVKR